MTVYRREDRYFTVVKSVLGDQSAWIAFTLEPKCLCGAAFQEFTGPNARMIAEHVAETWIIKDVCGWPTLSPPNSEDQEWVLAMQRQN